MAGAHRHGHVITDGAINGRQIAVLLDTGAMQTLVLRSAAERLDLTRWDVNGARMYGVGGESVVARTLVDEFRVGQFGRSNLQMIVAGERDFGADVLLGEDFFRQFDVEFDLAANRVRLYRAENCAATRLAYWAGADVGQVEFDPARDGRPEIVLTVEVNGRPILALLDSGAARSILDRAEAAQVGIAPDTPGVVAAPARGGLGSHTIPSWIGSFKTFTIGNETIRDTEIAFADVFKGAAFTRIGSNIPVKVEGLPSMLLGCDFLRSHRVLIAHSQHRIYFTYNGGPVFARARPAGRAAPDGGQVGRVADSKASSIQHGKLAVGLAQHSLNPSARFSSSRILTAGASWSSCANVSRVRTRHSTRPSGNVGRSRRAVDESELAERHAGREGVDAGDAILRGNAHHRRPVRDDEEFVRGLAGRNDRLPGMIAARVQHAFQQLELVAGETGEQHALVQRDAGLPRLVRKALGEQPVLPVFQREVVVREERVAIDAGVDQPLPPRAGLGKNQCLVAAVQFVARLRQQARRGGVDALTTRRLTIEYSVSGACAISSRTTDSTEAKASAP